jgi:hypothetical protein
MAVPGASKYSEYSAMSVFAGRSGFEKNFAPLALPRILSRTSYVKYGQVVS